MSKTFYQVKLQRGTKTGLPQRDLVYEVVLDYYKQNPKSTLSDLQRAFPAAVQKEKLEIVVDENEAANKNVDGNGKPRKRYQIFDNVKLSNGKNIAICNQWGIKNTGSFIDHATQMGYQIAVDGEPMPTTAKNVKNTKNNNVSIGSIIAFGGYNWQVLDIQLGEALLLSEHILENRPYNKKEEDITWENCTLRQYLNNEFYKKFPTADRNKIASRTIANSNNPWFHDPSKVAYGGGNNTKDNIFLLSVEEVVKYLGDGSLRRPKKMSAIEKKYWNDVEWMEDGAPDWFKKMGYPEYSMGIDWDDKGNLERVAKNISGRATRWWLRSPGFNNVSATLVLVGGSIHVYGNTVSYSEVGVRPALWLKI
ncbi:MAG: DUF6273 domain-containing protein [Defluviitaleaceae bacterium]|nr:DUF6273 domain-containing protein [Defluviitaleaceae bacterium]